MTNSKENRTLTAIIGELVAIKKLLILTAHNSGATQEQIGKALGLTDRQIRRILSQK